MVIGRWMNAKRSKSWSNLEHSAIRLPQVLQKPRATLHDGGVGFHLDKDVFQPAHFRRGKEIFPIDDPGPHDDLLFMVIRGVVLKVGGDETAWELAEIFLGLVTRGDRRDLELHLHQ